MKDKNEKIQKALQKMTEELAQEPDAKERCREYLIKHGYYNADGTIHKNYGGE